MVKALENTVVALHSTRGGFIVTGCLAWSLWRSALMLSNVAASFAGHFRGGKGVSGLEKGLKGVELTVVGKAGGVSSSDGRGSDGMAGIGDGGSVVSSSVSRGSDGMSGVGNGGSMVGSNGGSNGSNGKGLLVDVGLSGDLEPLPIAAVAAPIAAYHAAPVAYAGHAVAAPAYAGAYHAAPVAYAGHAVAAPAVAGAYAAGLPYHG